MIGPRTMRSVATVTTFSTPMRTGAGTDSEPALVVGSEQAALSNAKCRMPKANADRRRISGVRRRGSGPLMTSPLCVAFCIVHFELNPIITVFPSEPHRPAPTRS
jgi:hypothetical protein